MSPYKTRLETHSENRLASGLFFQVVQDELVQPLPIRNKDLANQAPNYDEFVVPEYLQSKEGDELYLPLVEVSVDVEVVGTISWTKLTQTFTNRSIITIKEAIYCFPLYDKSSVTSFTCSIGSEKVLKGVVKPKSQAKAEFKAAVARQCVAALLEEHTPEVFETSVGNIPPQSTVKIEICYLIELKADLSGDGILVTIPTSVAPRYGSPPSTLSNLPSSSSLAVPPENGLQIRIQVSSPVAIKSIESRTHPAKIEMGSHGTTMTRDIRDLTKKQESLDYDPKKASATLSDRNACLGKDFVLLIQSRDGTLLASCVNQEAHLKLLNHSALMVSVNLRDIYTPDVVAPKSPSEIIFLADRSGSMEDKIEALRAAMGFFLKSLPNNCCFNICSFGSNHVLMWPKSKPYNQENLDEAISYVAANFSADMGGTELLPGLQHVVQKRNPAFKTQIMVLTDGEVWNTANTLEFIRQTKSVGGNEETRFFALGIGDAVSHRLIEGIGRYGGGLAEVVSVNSIGDWKGRIIRMLEAALTPSTWKVEITLDDVSTTANAEERVFVRAPHQIPDLHAFSRFSLYFLFSQELKAKKVKVKATATSGETVTTELPIQKLEHGRPYIHQLAARTILNDLESGKSWLHHIHQKRNGKCTADVEDLARVEGEKIGLEWSIMSKWTSFVVVDTSNSLEKPSRWYQAEKTDLADLTRTRLGSAFKMASQVKRYDALGEGGAASSKPMFQMGQPHRTRILLGEAPVWKASTARQRKSETSRFGEELKREREKKSTEQAGNAHDAVACNYSEECGGYGGDSGNYGGDSGCGCDPGSYFVTEDGCAVGDAWGFAAQEAQFSSAAESEVSSRMYNGSFTGRFISRGQLDVADQVGDLRISGNREGELSAEKVVEISYFQAFATGQSFLELERQRMTREIALEELTDAQTAEGSFKLGRELYTALKAKFKHWRFDLLVSELGEDILFENLGEVLETAQAIVFINSTYAESQDLWRLVVQKAEGFIATVISKKEQMKTLLEVLGNQLSGGQEIIIKILEKKKSSRIREDLDRILSSSLLDESEELLQLLRRDGLDAQRDSARDKEKRISRISNIWRRSLFGSRRGKYQSGKQVDGGKRGEDPDEWIDGWDDILKVSQGVKTSLEKQNFGNDDLLQEGFQEAIDKIEITLKIVDKLDCGGSYSEVVIKDGILIIQTLPDQWGYG